jgi:hypothetical protein
VEIVLPGPMTVIDVAFALQHKIAAMTDVKRAFLHGDHHEHMLMV